MKTNSYEKAAEMYPDEIPEPFDSFYKSAGFKALYYLVDGHGGTSIYIPKTKALFKNCLINAIREEYNGENIKELAKDYDYSVNGIKNIINEYL